MSSHCGVYTKYSHYCCDSARIFPTLHGRTTGPLGGHWGEQRESYDEHRGGDHPGGHGRCVDTTRIVVASYRQTQRLWCSVVVCLTAK